MKIKVVKTISKLGITQQVAKVIVVKPFGIPSGVPATAFTEKGGLLTGTGAGTYMDLPPGTDGQFVMYDQTQPGGIRAATAPNIGNANLMNKDGTDRVIGDVVVSDPADDSAFKTTTMPGNPTVIGVLVENIANNAVGAVAVAPRVLTVNVTGNVTRGNYLKSSATAGMAMDAGTALGAGNFAVALTGYGGGGNSTVQALLLIGLSQEMNLPEGCMRNGRIVPSVASNILTVAVKTWAGNDPSPIDPVTVIIGGVARQITAALSVVKVTGTSWANLSSAELTGKEVDLFTYLVWNTALATPAVDMFWSRIPWGALFSDFSATTTNEKYAAQTAGATAPNSTDVCVNIGRFAATLTSAGGNLWSAPTFTAINLINRPIYETRLLSFTSVSAGFLIDYTRSSNYQIIGRQMYFGSQGTGDGTSNATTFTLTLPFNPSIQAVVVFLAGDNGAQVFSTCIASVGTKILTLCKGASINGGTWTPSGAKYAYFDHMFQIG